MTGGQIGGFIGACAGRERGRSRMGRPGPFGVNVLERQHEHCASRTAPPGADRFVGLFCTTDGR